MELVEDKLYSTIQKTTNFILKYVYKWFFPAIFTIATFVFADKHKNILILIVIWLFHCLAYISLPLNFENPKTESFRYLVQQNLVAIFWVLFQASFLSSFLFIITFVFIIWYLPMIASYSLLLSACNGFLYFLTIVMANYVVARKYDAI